ncbi:hypothetical protein ACSMXN_13440 [Jatrophihabitans sp. DSM 45814]
MTKLQLRNKIAVPAVLLTSLLGSGVLAACSSSSSKSPAAASSAASTSRGAGQGRGGAGFFANAQVQACLKAAGISIPSAGARPSGSFNRPSGRPTGTFSRPPGGFRSGARPSGVRPSGGGFGAFGGAEGTKIQAALKACGIALPSRPAGGATPSATPSGSNA